MRIALFKYVTIVQKLTKKCCIHYLTDLVFDRYLLDRPDSFEKKANKLNIHLEYSH